MKISAVIYPDIIKKDRLAKDKFLLLSFTVVALALVAGTVLYVFTEDYLTGEIWDTFTKFFVDFTSKTKIEVFSGMILAHLPYIMLMIIFGTSSVGYGFIVGLSFVKATGLGVLSAYLYSSFGLKGIEYALLVFFPGKFVLILSMLFLMHFCLNNSLYVCKLTKGECRAENNSTIYAVKVITAILLLVLSSLVDGFLAVSFSSLFSF